MNPKIQDWRGVRVWVVGASTGIGAATAQHLLSLGARVALSARNETALRQLAAGNGQALILPLDVTNRSQLLAARDQLMAAWQGVDLVLMVAGVYREMRADAIDIDAVEQMLDVNLRAVFHVLDAVLPTMLAQGRGGVGIVSSVAGFGGLPRALGYGPTKAALINLAETLYLDLHAKGLGVYLINPGFVDTPATKQNDFEMPALISPQEAAVQIVQGMERGEFHIHFPRRFTNWLRFAQLLPYRAYFWLIHKVTGL
ncbi:MAG: SDR family NAD(P)-dependent oxidoreductase [Oxalobacteraceae bacterium]|nr:SDR family NAD(P)-dependent oxidoreductase [Oxalobacteraceae bacterium]